MIFCACCCMNCILRWGKSIWHWETYMLLWVLASLVLCPFSVSHHIWCCLGERRAGPWSTEHKACWRAVFRPQPFLPFPLWNLHRVTIVLPIIHLLSSQNIDLSLAAAMSLCQLGLRMTFFLKYKATLKSERPRAQWQAEYSQWYYIYGSWSDSFSLWEQLHPISWTVSFLRIWNQFEINIAFSIRGPGAAQGEFQHTSPGQGRV